MWMMLKIRTFWKLQQLKRKGHTMALDGSQNRLNCRQTDKELTAMMQKALAWIKRHKLTKHARLNLGINILLSVADDNLLDCDSFCDDLNEVVSDWFGQKS
jgi:hypothetical protein